MAAENLTTIQRCVFMIEDRHGDTVSVYLTGYVDEFCLDAVDAWASRQRERLAKRRRALQLCDVWEQCDG